MKRNSIKFYDHLNVLRIETTINNPAEFKILHSSEKDDQVIRRWCPMRKGVSNFWRYAQVAKAANERLIHALANTPLQGNSTDALDRLCRSHQNAGHHIAAFNPVEPQTVALFTAILSGEFAINGFRNADLKHKLFLSQPKDPHECKRRTHRVCRLIAKLRGHGLIAKVKDSRLYRVTTSGIKTMWAAIRFRNIDFPNNFNATQSFAQ